MTAAMLSAKQADDQARRKRLDTLRAQLALKGFEVRQLASGAWLVSKWSLTREVSGPGLDGLEGFARQVGAAS